MTSAGDQTPDSLNSPPRVPKLQYRNRGDVDDITPVETAPASRAGPTAVNTTPDRPPNDRNLPSSSGTNSPPFHSLHDSSPKSATEKRKRGVLGFFTLKEPSTSAWEEFAQQQRAEAQKGPKPSGYSTKKLPETVPKVNSKWDGLPKGVQRPSTANSMKKSIDVASPTSKRSEDVNSPSSSQGKKERSLNSRSGHTQNPSEDTTANSKVGAVPTEASPPVHDVPDTGQFIGPSMSTESTTIDSPNEEVTDFSPPPEISLFFAPGNHLVNQRAAPPSAPVSIPTSAGISAPTTATTSVPRDPVPTYEPNSTIAPEPVYNITDLTSKSIHTQPVAAQETRSVPASKTPAEVVEPPRVPTLRKTPRSAGVAALPADLSFFGRGPAKQDAGATAQTKKPSRPDAKKVTKQSSEPGLRTPEHEVDDGPAAAPNVPIRKQSQETGSEPSADSSPYGPRTPEDTSTIDLHPAVRHSRKRSTEDAPKWPLASAAGAPPPVPAKSERRLSASSIEESLQAYRARSGSESDPERSQLDGSMSPSRREKTIAPTPPVRSFSRPLPVAQSSSASSRTRPTAAPMGTISIVRNQQTYTQPKSRAPPALQPGRVLTKDSDLATIPESDTASVRTLSAHMGPGTTSAGNNADYANSDNDRALRTTMDFTDSEADTDEYGDYEDDEDERKGVGFGLVNVGDTQPKSEPQAVPGAAQSLPSKSPGDWYSKSPRERLGLGGFIRRNGAGGAPWETEEDGGTGGGDANDEAADFPPPILPASINGNGSEAAAGKRGGSLRTVFKRS